LKDKTTLRKADMVEIITVVDNFVELLTMDGNEIIHRFMPIKDMKMASVVVAEHGFSAIFRTTLEGSSHSVLMDFGQAPICVDFNLDALEVDLSEIEALALSHGHIDHFGGLLNVLKKIPAKPLPLVLHPAAFTPHRYFKFPGDYRCDFPELDRSAVTQAGATLVETTTPYLMGDDSILFLGEIERVNDFEKGMPSAYYEEDGKEIKDQILDDSSLVADLKGKGLVILSGCAHAGIINTVNYARKVTGVERVHVIMGGFHLVGPTFEPLIGRTIDEMKQFAPDYVAPCHCTGRKAIMAFEREMPEAFILNQSGTTLVFRKQALSNIEGKD
jgi:7,8-dihydropterin-6-yl-methyl-4-(beta-D-ribofuranosyl)aminobenzene 5'-phosphate synthase